MAPDPSTPPAPPVLATGRRFLRWLLVWAVGYAVALLLYNASYAFTRDLLIHHVQVRPAAWILRHTLPDIPVSCRVDRIEAPGLSLVILRGCDGVEVWLLLVTAFAVFPQPWRSRLAGIGYGTLLVFGLNLLRIVTMFHITLRKPDWFEVAHGLIWQSVMVLAVALFVLARLRPVEAQDAERIAP